MRSRRDVTSTSVATVGVAAAGCVAGGVFGCNSNRVMVEAKVVPSPVGVSVKDQVAVSLLDEDATGGG
ncbi:hypothetical protein [Halorubellus sp. PRR65]|uniref:hypothetical protein n=1 Tax=Halorubellus sp. PRR65 TaxID=3098148 RepID=UPI002B25E420|nr:hypothetical protein [Halorubellus sp. PRR65]